MRKFLSVILVCLMMFSVMPTALAQGNSGKISQEEALKIAKEAFGISDTWKDVQVDYREEAYLNRKLWSFNWNISRFGQYEHIQVDLDADNGEVISYWHSEDPSKRTKPEKIYSEAECQAIAESLVKQLAPEKFKATKLKAPDDDDFGWYDPYGYRFVYERYVNDIPFVGNSLSISIDRETGKVSNYNCSWDEDVQFPQLEDIVSVEEAQAIYREKVGFQLSYQKPYGPYPVKPFVKDNPIDLFYSQTNNYGYYSPNLVDAQTGLIVDPNGQEISVAQKVYFPNQEVTEPAQLDEPLTLEAAQDLVTEYIQVPSEYKARSSRYSEGWGAGAKKVWEFNYGKDSYNPGEEFQVTIDALTGELINYFQWEQPWDEQVDKPIQYDYQACQAIAEKYLKKVNPTRAEQVYLLQDSNVTVNKMIVNGKEINNPRFGFRFVRLVQGVPFTGNGIDIQVNNNTGKITEYRLNWDSQATFANPEPGISEAEAMDKLLAESPCELVYTRKIDPKVGYAAKPGVMLVYRLFGENPKIVNASTGELVDLYKRTKPARLDDIRGHWAEREIQNLNMWGVVSGFQNKFQPDKKITRAEFVQLLVSAGGLVTEENASQTFTDVAPDAWYFGAVEAASKAGIIKGSGDKFYPNRLITRQEIVVMLMNAFNQGEQPESLGELPNQFRDEAKIAPWAQQAMLQALEMGILQGQNGYLKPDQSATKAEAAVILSRVLEQALRNYRYY